ncbi:MAG: transcription elongation factor GreA [Bacteroidia bacterium]|nr:transcription elongation factor GreA [Bacteroidia bacterium]MCX7652919.1 transcription elongation factor GreA [Bacteroidia bacterium]MDW8416613.1 transcription elongation factor GreA [Bacteroidia bacterium]
MSRVLTKEAFERLKEELHELKTTKRAQVAAAIAEAREKGDLSENAEYAAAKEEQRLLEARIAELEAMLAQSQIVDLSHTDHSKISLLATVRILNLSTNQEAIYTLVSAVDANVRSGKISVESPIGKALLGRSVGEEVIVQVPAGQMRLKILEIRYE